MILKRLKNMLTRTKERDNGHDVQIVKCAQIERKFGSISDNGSMEYYKLAFNEKQHRFHTATKYNSYALKKGKGWEFISTDKICERYANMFLNMVDTICPKRKHLQTLSLKRVKKMYRAFTILVMQTELNK